MQGAVDLGQLHGRARAAEHRERGVAQLAAAKGQRERQASLVGVAESFSLRAATGQLLRSIKEQDGRWMPEDVPADLRTAYERGLAMDTESGFAYALEDVP